MWQAVNWAPQLVRVLTGELRGAPERDPVGARFCKVHEPTGVPLHVAMLIYEEVRSGAMRC